MLAQARQFLVIRRDHHLHPAILGDGKVFAAAMLGHVAPGDAGLAVVAALDGVDDDAAPARFARAGHGAGQVDVIVMRRRVAHQEHHLRGARSRRRPAACAQRFHHRAAHVFRAVAAAFGPKAHQLRIHAVKVVAERGDARHVGVAAVAVGYQPDPDADAGMALLLQHVVDDAPYFRLRPFQHAAHRAGGVEHEHQLDRGARMLLADDRARLDLVAGGGGLGRNKGQPGEQERGEQGGVA